MTFADEPSLLRTPREFAKATLRVELPDDLGPEISNLLGFTKNFYLQFFQEQYGIEISRLDAAGRKRVQNIEHHTRQSEDQAARLLLSHYITISTALDEGADTSEELELSATYEEVLYAVLELLDRIADWAESRGLPKTAAEARLTYGEFEQAIASLVPL